MGLLSNKIDREKLKPGDHIYSWRNAYLYAHHGIYVGEGKVIHFTRAAGREIGTGSVLDRFIFSSSPSHSSENPCTNCDDLSGRDGSVMSSCLDCFLSGGDLYLFEYGVNPAIFIAKDSTLVYLCHRQEHLGDLSIFNLGALERNDIFRSDGSIRSISAFKSFNLQLKETQGL